MAMRDRRHTRAKWHRYDGATYFVTVCTLGREHSFGEIHNGEMYLSPLGHVLEEAIARVNDPLRKVIVPESVIMPNHFHLLLCVDNVCPALAGNIRSGAMIDRQPTRCGETRERLGVIIGGIKGYVTHLARRGQIDFHWQSRFHDRIVRTYEEYARIASYIRCNPSSWHDDCFFT